MPSFWTGEHKTTAQEPGEILGNCARCGLVVYKADPHQFYRRPSNDKLKLYHLGCFAHSRAEMMEETIGNMKRELERLGWTIDYKVREVGR